MNEVIQKIGLILAFGAITTVVSEFWFYQMPEDTIFVEVLLMYGLIAYFFIALLSHFKVHSLSGLIVAACFFGFLIESLPVPVLYTAIPFTIVWTSMAWHGLLTILVGWYWYRQTLVKGSWFQITTYNIFLGLGVGIWGAYTWNIIENADGSVLYSWQSPDLFLKQLLFSFVLFVFGHIVSNILLQKVLHVRRYDWLVLIGLTSLLYAVQLFSFFPFSLILIPLVILSIRALSHESLKEVDYLGSPFLTRESIRYLKWLPSMLIPVVAYGVYLLMYTYRIEFETNAVFALVTSIIIVPLWIRSLWKLFRN